MPRPQNATRVAAVAGILFSALFFFFVVFWLMWLPVAANPVEPGAWLRGGDHVALAMNCLLRFRDLKERGIVNSWPQLKRLQQLHEFPLGRMLSPNIRAWTEAEINGWIESRPRENTRPLQGAPKAKHERRIVMLSEGKGA